MNPVADASGEIGQFEASDGYIHHYRRWSPNTPPRGKMVALHGIQSHSGWYDWSSLRLAASGIDVRFFDRRGSGMNESQRGHTVSAERLITDIVEFVTDVRSDGPSRCPMFLSSVSWGGKLATAVARSYPDLVDGLLLLYPAIRTHIEPRWWQRAAIRMLSRAVLGRKTVPVPLNDPLLFTNDADWQQFIAEDDLALHRVTLSFLNATLDLTRQAETAASSLSCPTLVMLAGRDQIVDVTAMREWAAGIPESLRTVIEYPEAAHTLEFDACREQFVVDLLGWIESQCHSDNKSVQMAEKQQEA